MTSIEKPNVNLYEPSPVSGEEFRIENAASVAIENCLNEGVHLRGMLGVLSEGDFTWTPSSGPQDEILVFATQNYMGNPVTLAVPDLSGVSGFLTPPPSGTRVAWFETVFQGTFPTTTSPAGGAQTYVQADGNYIVP